MNNGHALLSPSGAKRWLACTPSARLEALEPSGESSTFAMEGTEAHELAELKLSYTLGKINETQYDVKYAQFIANSKYHNDEFEDFVDKYCDSVMTIIECDYGGMEEVRKGNVEVLLEQVVSFEHVVPDGKGTSDVVIYSKKRVHVIDLKFGKGIPVSAIDNPQLRLYGIGAVREYAARNFFAPTELAEVSMTIIQPRLYDSSTETLHISDLTIWGNDYVRPRALMAHKGEGEIVPGDHCKFCRCGGKCAERGEKQLQLAQAEFAIAEESNDASMLEPRNMTEEQLARVLRIAPAFIDWFKEVQSYAHGMMIGQGVEIPGFKVVRGRSNRIMTSPEAIAEKLRTSGFHHDEYLEPVPKRKLKSITKLEKYVGKKLFNTLCGDYIFKPDGKLTVVPEDDKRPAIDAGDLRLDGQEF